MSTATSKSPQSVASPISNPNGDESQKSLEKTLQKENKRLRSDIKQMEIKVKTMQGELKKSNQVKDRLEALCRELQKQNRYIKAESSAKITEANEKGKELAQEVQSNMGFIKNINENLASITSETIQVRKENEDLAKKIATLKNHYEEREQVMKTVIDETTSALHSARLELGELKLKNAQEKEKLLNEMQQLSTALIQSREQMKEAKETEINLRLLLQNYDEKFNSLQKALKDTNGAYEEFKSEMSRVTNRTKDLEKETLKWQNRWEESTKALKLMKENHAKLQGELAGAEQSLEKMKGLCRALQNERKDLLEELKTKMKGQIQELKNGSGSTTPVDELVLSQESKDSLGQDIESATPKTVESVQESTQPDSQQPSDKLNQKATKSNAQPPSNTTGQESPKVDSKLPSNTTGQEFTKSDAQLPSNSTCQEPSNTPENQLPITQSTTQPESTQTSVSISSAVTSESSKIPAADTTPISTPVEVSPVPTSEPTPSKEVVSKEAAPATPVKTSCENKENETKSKTTPTPAPTSHKQGKKKGKKGH